MTTIVGVDGCKLGWLGILEEFPSGKLGSKIFPKFEDLAKHISQLEVIAIDIPIGLTDAGPRACDVAARKLLGGARASSVFPAPIRPALSGTSYEDACARAFAAQGKKFSKQAWAIFPKIGEVDDALRSNHELSEKVFEVHPEVSFCAWNTMKAFVEPKKSAEGAARRGSLIASHFGASAFDTIRARYKRKDVADDDIMDAFAALWTAERVLAGRSSTLPESPTNDSAGLPMRMVY